MRDVKGSISSNNHGCDRSSSLILDLCFCDFDFQCPPPLSLLSESISVLGEHVLSCLLNTPPSLLPFPFGLCLRDSDLSRLILEKTLVRLGLPYMLRERLEFCPLWCSLLTFRVLDSECCDTFCAFEFLLEHPSKLRQYSWKPASDAGLFRSLVGLDLQALLGSYLALKKVFEMISCTSESKPLALPWGRALQLDFGMRWPEWDSCRERVRGYRNCGSGFSSADASRSVDGMRKRPVTNLRLSCCIWAVPVRFWA
nr:hypothetical protein [Tanacetum cinerariifolium]